MPKRDGGKKDETGRLKICPPTGRFASLRVFGAQISPQTGRFAFLRAFGAKRFPSNGTLRVPSRLRYPNFPLKFAKKRTLRVRGKRKIWGKKHYIKCAETH